MLAAGGSDGQIHVWSTSDFKPLFADLGHQGALRAVVAGRDGRGVLTIGSDNTARLWDGRSGKMLHRFGTAERPVAAASISPDGRTVALGDRDGIVRLADARTGRARREVKVDGGMKRGVAFLPGGKKLIAVGEAFTITTVDVATGKIDRVSRTARADVTRVSVSGDYRVAASADRQLAYAWELHTGKPLGAFGAKGIPSIYATAIDAYGRLLAADAGQKVVVFELDSGRVVRELPFAGRRTGGTTIDFSPDGAVLAVPDRSGVIEFRSVFTGAELGRRAGHRGLVVAMRFLPDGRRMLTGSADSTAILWDLARLKPARTPTGGRFDTKRLERLWEELSSADAAAAQKAIGELADGGDESVKLFARVLRPAEDPSTGQMQRLTADLDDPHFAVRRRATNELARMGAMAETTLRRVVADSASEEVRARAQELLEALDDPHRRTGAVIRQLRAVHALERIGTRAAIDLLGKLARGAEEANLTRRARAAVDRLRHR